MPLIAALELPEPAWILPVPPASDDVQPQTAITVTDRRWSMCHLKTTGLMLNVLAKQQAVESAAPSP